MQDRTSACGILNTFFNVILGVAVIKNCVPLATVDEVFQVLFRAPSNPNDTMDIALNGKLDGLEPHGGCGSPNDQRCEFLAGSQGAGSLNSR